MVLIIAVEGGGSGAAGRFDWPAGAQAIHIRSTPTAQARLISRSSVVTCDGEVKQSFALGLEPALARRARDIGVSHRVGASPTQRIC